MVVNQEMLSQILPRNEAKIYLALLELGQSTSGPIIKATKIHSSKVYESLQRLITKGLVSYVIKGGVKYFQPVSPENLIDFLEEKKSKINAQEKKITDILPQLLLKFKEAKVKYVVEVFEGYKGLKSAFDDALKDYKKGQEYYVYGIPQVSTIARRFFDIPHTKDRMKRGIKIKAIFNAEARKRGEKYKKVQLTQVKFLPAGLATQASINVFKDKIIMVIGVLEEPLVISITSKQVANSFRSHFGLLWKLARE